MIGFILKLFCKHDFKQYGIDYEGENYSSSKKYKRCQFVFRVDWSCIKCNKNTNTFVYGNECTLAKNSKAYRIRKGLIAKICSGDILVNKPSEKYTYETVLYSRRKVKARLMNNINN